MTEARQRLGRTGEDLAATFLVRQGFEIVARNYRTRGGEIDLIARHRGILHIVEVKTSRSTCAGDPLDWVTPRKQSRLIRMARHFLARQPVEPPLLFSVLAINLATTPPALTWLPDAFQA